MNIQQELNSMHSHLMYKKFPYRSVTSLELEEWQKDNVDANVINVSPVITNLEMDISDPQATAETRAKVVVLYSN